MNYIEVGETAASLARRIAPGMTESAVSALSREGTALLERSGFLSRLDSNHTIAHWLSDAARDAVPAIQRAAGNAPHAGGDLLVVGKPLTSTIGSDVVPRANAFSIYEPHQNISIYQDGKFRIDYPTPSAQRIRSDHYAPDGRWAGTTYSSSHADGYGFMPAPEGLSATVASQFGSRQLMFDSAWDASRANFTINPVIDKFIQESKPVTGVSNLSAVIGRTVSTPIADGKLIGFDRVSGEALVTHDGFHSTGLSFDVSASSKQTNHTYPVRLHFANDAQITVQRTPTGKFSPFTVGSSDPSFKPNTTIFAFSPVEVKVGERPLSEILGVENSTGLRAMGGYSTIDGARVPIISPELSHAPRLSSELAPRAFVDPIARVTDKIKPVEEATPLKPQMTENHKPRPLMDAHQIALQIERQRLDAEAAARHAAHKSPLSTNSGRSLGDHAHRLISPPDALMKPAKSHSSPIARYSSPLSSMF